MSVSIVDRLTQAIRIAEQSSLSAQYQADYRNWHEVHRVLQDARDELTRPASHRILDGAHPNFPADGSGPVTSSAADLAASIKRGPGRPRKEAA